MKVLPFTVYVPDDRSVISEYIAQPHFYQFLHRHDKWQITWVKQGEGTLIAGNSMHSFQPGDVFLIGANLPHLFKSNPEYFASDKSKNISACSLYFNPSGILKPLFDLPEMKMLSSFLQQNKHGFKIPQAFCRYFKQHTGHTFVSFLNEVRVNDACNKVSRVSSVAS